MFMIHFAGVSWKDGKAKKGECKKCEETGGPFSIVRECQDKRCSCKGLKEKSKETEECTKYCPSNGPSTGRMKHFYIIQTNRTVLETADKVPLRGVYHCKFLLMIFIY